MNKNNNFGFSRPFLATLFGCLITSLVLPLKAQEIDDLPAAARAGNIELIIQLLGNGFDVNAAQGDGATALHWASHRNDLELVNLLIGYGAEVDVSNDLGATPLWLATLNGSALVTDALLIAGANPNVSLKMGETPLMSAARSGNLDVVSLLINAGSDVDAAEKEKGQTALMWSVAQGHAEIADLLIKNGADVGARSKIWYQLENTAGNTNPSGNFKMAHGGSSAILLISAPSLPSLPLHRWCSTGVSASSSTRTTTAASTMTQCPPLLSCKYVCLCLCLGLCKSVCAVVAMVVVVWAWLQLRELSSSVCTRL